MICSLNCFCDFMEAQTPERQASVIRKYRKGASAPAKGMVVYYRPALSAMRGRLAASASEDETLRAIREACFLKNWPDKLIDARIEANIYAYRAFREEFGQKKLRIFSNPRMQFLASPDLAVNMQPEFYAEVDGVVTMWKFGMTKKKRNEQIIRSILQMLLHASRHRGLNIPIQQIRFLDLRNGNVYVEDSPDALALAKLEEAATSLAAAWAQAA